MSEKLNPCPFCGGVIVIEVYDYLKWGLCTNPDCRACFRKGKVFDADESMNDYYISEKSMTDLVDLLKTRAPLYSPVKPEDITAGYYWLVDPDGNKMVDRVACKYTVGGAEEVHVNDLAEAGFTFYRIPYLEGAE